MTGITYFCTDSQGHTYNRHSNGHSEPRFKTAAISRSQDSATGPVTKHCVTYSSNQAKGFTYGGWSYEVVPVRAYPGKHKVEPIS